MAAPSADATSVGLLQSLTDDVVRLLQGLAETLSSFYEENMRSPTGPDLCMPTLEAVQLACHQAHENLASLWPCQQQFVAVLGRTGCGKSTLLNLLLSLLCASGHAYAQGIRSDSARAVLRDAARLHRGLLETPALPGALESIGDHAENENVASQASILPKISECVAPEFICTELLAFKSLLGICCAQDKQAYMNKHIPLYDAHPFILQNGRLGDAGTTKVTAIEYGPKFVGRVRWMTRKKLRKKLRDLRQLIDNSMEPKMTGELREFWSYVCLLVGLPRSEERPTEEQIEIVINELGNMRGFLDKEEFIQTPNMKGSIIDRMLVREGIKEKFSQDLGKLIENLSIQVPVSSFEGGISLLDVPGTNDPRILHQRETRAAIDQTSLILLVLDKSVIDVETEELLVNSILLERMLTDETVNCALVVVGIAEKENKKGLCPKDLVSGFDPKQNILTSLKKIFRKIVARLVKNKRLEAAHALKRLDSLFANSICLIPVLPFLCTSLHLSIFNPQLHQSVCESKSQKCCPLWMSQDELRESYKQTNIPQLLEKIHSVRVPPNLEELQHIIHSTEQSLYFLTQPTVPDASYVEFLKAESKRATRISAKYARVEAYPDQNENLHLIEGLLEKCADECRLPDDEIAYLCGARWDEILSQIQTDRFLLGPFILRGFRPEVIGKKANELIEKIGRGSQEFVEQALENLNSMRGNEASMDARFDKLADAYVPLALNLHVQLRGKWDLSLKRLRAKCFCAGVDDGLLGRVREALRSAYNGGLKYLYKSIKKHNKAKNGRDTLQKLLESNEIGLYATNIAKHEVKVAVDTFWQNLLEVTNKEVQFLWKSWQVDIKKLAECASDCLQAKKNILWKEKMGLSSLPEDLAGKMKELSSLKRVLDDPWSEMHRICDYGCRLLQPDLCFSVDTMINDMQSVPLSRSQPSETGRIVSQHTDTITVKDFTSSSDGTNRTADGRRCVLQNKLGSHKKISRKAQILSEVESHKLQKREGNANHARKQPQAHNMRPQQ